MTNELNNAQDRTKAKLCYARLHLDELRLYHRKGSGDDFERCHIESFLFHLFGARDAFLQELNLYYDCGLELHEVSVHRLDAYFKNKGVNCTELEELGVLEAERGSWLHNAKEMRNHSTHRQSIPRVFHVGGPDSGEVHLKDPKTGESLKEDFVITFEEWCEKIEKLLNKLRNSSLKIYQSNKAS